MRGGLGFLLMNIILFFAMIGFTLVVFELNSLEFVLEFVGLLAFIFCFAFGMFFAYNSKKFGWTIIAVTLFVVMLDTILVMVFARNFGIRHIITIFFSLAGLALSFFTLQLDETGEIDIQDFSKPKDYYEYLDKMEPK